jgi:hypothetical protein
VVGALLVAAFIGWELRTREPMLPLHLFRSRGFADSLRFANRARPGARIPSVTGSGLRRAPRTYRSAVQVSTMTSARAAIRPPQ